MTPADLVCEDCGKRWECPRYAHPARRNAWTGRFQKQHTAEHHATAARVQGWTVWWENSGLRRVTILCPDHRKDRGIIAHVVSLGGRS